MNYGPLVFLAAFVAMSASWYGLVVKPTMQVGRLLQTNIIGGSMTYPMARPGLAAKGSEVYRANGCAYCHSQQVTQTGTVFQVVLTDSGTNRATTVAALLKLEPKLNDSHAHELLNGAPPQLLLTLKARSAADAAVTAINATSAKAVLQVTPVGPDIARGWGRRRSVAEDFLFDSPPMPGSQRVGPDLANVGARLPDPAWHLRHLYAPRLDVTNSIMPPYPYLFEVRKSGGSIFPSALQLPAEFAPPQGYEVFPTPEAQALAAYLVSLRSDAPLFSAPLNVAATAPSPSPDAPNGSQSPTNSAAQ